MSIYTLSAPLVINVFWNLALQCVLYKIETKIRCFHSMLNQQININIKIHQYIFSLDESDEQFVSIMLNINFQKEKKNYFEKPYG